MGVIIEYSHGSLSSVKVTIISGIQRPEDDQPLAILGPQAMQDCLRARTTFFPDFLQRVVGHLERQDGGYEYPIKEYRIPDYNCDDSGYPCSKVFTSLLVILLGLAKNECVQFPQDVDDIWLEEAGKHLPLCSECKYALESAFDKGRNEAWEGLPYQLNLERTFKVS